MLASPHPTNSVPSPGGAGVSPPHQLCPLSRWYAQLYFANSAPPLSNPASQALSHTPLTQHGQPYVMPCCFNCPVRRGSGLGHSVCLHLNTLLALHLSRWDSLACTHSHTLVVLHALLAVHLLAYSATPHMFCVSTPY